MSINNNASQRWLFYALSGSLFVAIWKLRITHAQFPDENQRFGSFILQLSARGNKTDETDGLDAVGIEVADDQNSGLAESVLLTRAKGTSVLDVPFAGWHDRSFRSENEQFFARSRKSRI
ncbi:MAG: hypothetical protein ACSLFH_01575 [Desulfuromonadales bacterium]